ncbi:MAG: hypothetical protein KIT84_00320 [Labilithrix sp.]|nr:hypothetical protein [Labilithrix sp.]MCW5809427.1 hypothetical protein [Labilithrix sp.]
MLAGACSDRSAPDASAAIDGGGLTDVTSPPSADDPAARFRSPARLRHEQSSFGSLTQCPGSAYDARSMTVDFAAKTMLVDACESLVDAGADAGDARTTFTVTLTDDDAAALRALVEALREDLAAADAGCAGYDGSSLSMELTVADASAPFTLRAEHSCSAPRPDVIVERAGFLALREKLNVLAGLNPAVPPT